MDEQRSRQRAYFHEVSVQCRFALSAFADFQLELQELFANPEQVMQSRRAGGNAQPGLNERAFFHMQALLVAAANVSKLLWPGPKPQNRERADKRAVTLRYALHVPAQKKDSPIGSRTLRDCFEHFDEHLDNVLEQNGGIADMNIGAGPVSGAFGGNIPSLRYYDLTAHEVTFLGDSLSLSPLVQELQRLATLAGELEQATYHSPYVASA